MPDMEVVFPKMIMALLQIVRIVLILQFTGFSV